MSVIEDIEKNAVNLRALDRQRHNGVGMKRLGFIEAAFRIAKQYPQYYPHWLWTGKFQNDRLLFRAVSALVEACRSLEEKAWNIHIESADMVYTDALEYYSQVQDAAERRVDAAETIYNELKGFFHGGEFFRNEETPEDRKVKRDVNALLHGKKDGEIIIRNVSPKMDKGSRKIIEETLKDDPRFIELKKKGLWK
jgi:hypothetical protein